MCHKLYISLLFLSIQFSMFSMDDSAEKKQQGFTEEAIIQALEDVVLSSVHEEKSAETSSRFHEAAKQLDHVCKAGIVVHEMPGRPCVQFKDEKGSVFWVDYALARENIAKKYGVYAEAKICTQNLFDTSAVSKSSVDSNWCE